MVSSIFTWLWLAEIDMFDMILADYVGYGLIMVMLSLYIFLFHFVQEKYTCSI